MTIQVANSKISEADIAREMQHHPGHDPHRCRIEAARALIVRELLRLEAAQRDIRAQPTARESAEEALIRELLVQAIEVPALTETDCRRFYMANRERLRAPDRVLVRHILFAAAPDDVEARLAARVAAEDAIAQIRAQPHCFADFAARLSACPSRRNGGELGWLERGQSVPEFERQVFRLKSGLAGLPVESRYGYHVVSVELTERGEPLGYEDAHALIADRLEVQVRQQAVQQFLTQLSKKYAVVGFDELAQTAATQSPAPAPRRPSTLNISIVLQ